jgi:hypothetical protein
MDAVNHCFGYPEGEPIAVAAEMLDELDVDSVQSDMDGAPGIMGYEGPSLSEYVDVETQSWVSEMRFAKTETEIDLIRGSCRWANLAHRYLYDLTEAGAHPATVSQRASLEGSRAMLDALGDQYVARSRGGGPVHAGYITGEQTRLPHGHTANRRLQEGDVAITGATANVDGYHSELERTMFLGEPDDEQTHLFALMLEAQTVAIETTAPGIPVAVIAEAVWDYYDEHGTGWCESPVAGGIMDSDGVVMLEPSGAPATGNVGEGTYEVSFQIDDTYLVLTSVGTYGDARSTVQLVASAGGGPASAWDNAILAQGAEAGSKAINGNVSVYGSVHIVDGDLDGTLAVGGTSGIYNTYRGEGGSNSDIVDDVDHIVDPFTDLCARLKVAKGNVYLESGSVQVGTSAEPIYSVHLGDGIVCEEKDSGTGDCKTNREVMDHHDSTSIYLYYPEGAGINSPYSPYDLTLPALAQAAFAPSFATATAASGAWQPASPALSWLPHVPSLTTSTSPTVPPPNRPPAADSPNATRRVRSSTSAATPLPVLPSSLYVVTALSVRFLSVGVFRTFRPVDRVFVVTHVR